MKNKNLGVMGNQKGMVSIIVTMILIILMTLVVLAMSQNANREQRQALDRQLSDQAFYNAESGINDWANYLFNNPDSVQDKTDCETDPANLGSYPGTVPDPRIDGSDGVNTYTCVLYNKAPTSIEYDNVDNTDSIVVAIEPTDLNGADRLKVLDFELKAGEGDSVTNGCNLGSGTLPTALPNDCTVDGLRIDLINTNGSRDAIVRNNYPLFIVPGNSSASGSADYRAGSIADQGEIGQAICDAGTCKFRIYDVDLRNGERLYLHMRGLYGGLVDVSISGCSAPAVGLGSCPNANQEVRFANAQMLLDVTGKANDVLRRVQVRVPVQNKFDTPGGFSLRTNQAICKLITVSQKDAQSTIDSSKCPL